MKKEVSKLIPTVYKDLAQPSVQRAGRTLADAVSTALRPADGVLWTVNKAFDWVSEAVSRRLAHSEVPRDRVIAPPALVEGRVLQGLQLAGPSEEPLMRNMFAALLATAMDRKTAPSVHPSMVSTLGQMVPDEARFLATVASRRIVVIFAENQARRWVSDGAWTYHFYDDILLPSVNDRNYQDFLQNLKHLGILDYNIPWDPAEQREHLHHPEGSRVFDQWREFAFRT